MFWKGLFREEVRRRKEGKENEEGWALCYKIFSEEVENIRFRIAFAFIPI